MDLRVTGWRYQNIRGGLRDISIQLGSPLPRWTLIQMPNGTGKTTTMDLLRAAFTGAPMDPNVVQAFRPADSIDSGAFEVQLLINGQPYRVELSFNYRAGIVTYWTSKSDRQGGGRQEGHLLPDDLKRLFTPAFARLFVFDGELAKQIRDLTKERAAQCIRTLYRLDTLQDLIGQMNRLVSEEQERAVGTKAMEPRGMNRLRNSFREAQDKLTELLTRKDSLERQRRDAEAERKRLDALVTGRKQQDDTTRAQMLDLTSQREAIDKQIMETAKRILVAMRGPAILHSRILQRLKNLGGKLDRLKLPKTMSAEFFEELASGDECVCGRPLGPEEKQAVRDRAHQYLAENQIAVINAMKLAVRGSNANPADLDEQIESVRGKLRERQELALKRDRLEADSIASGGEELRRMLDEMSDCERARNRHEAELDRLTVTEKATQRAYGLDWETNLPLCQQEVKEREDKLATATNTRRFLMQAQRATGALASIQQSALARLRDRVRDATNQKLVSFVPSEAIRVARIEGALELTSDALRSKVSVSEGQSLAVAYAFLTSLFEDAPYKLPFIVDSPAVPLDTAVRREVGEIIPDLFEQMIMFVISSEREGFADAFYGREGVRYITVWLEDGGATEIREGLEVFRSFHSREDRAQDATEPGRSRAKGAAP